LTEEKMIMFRNRLLKVFRHLSRQAKRLGVSCYRLYDHDLPEFPFCIEVYGDKLYIAEYKRRHGMTEAEHESWLERSLLVIEELLQVSKENIFLKLRMRKPGRLGQYQKHAGEQQEFIVEENRLKFIINLSDYLDTGLFLDHRTTREIVKTRSSEKKILNLFAYTGSFSVYAASGGASEVITVDLSKTYLSWAGRNLALNGFIDEKKYKLIHADVIQWLAATSQDYFDIIVMDPPTFSNSKRMEGFLDIQRDHVHLINDGLNALKKGGTLFFSTNFTRFILDKGQIMADSVKDITKTTTAFDFAGRVPRFCFEIIK
jgi:23S rRNA (cytosine1962-C5)-methyltransferase